MLAAVLFFSSATLYAQTSTKVAQPPKVKARCIALEVYTRASDAQAAEAVKELEKHIASKRGVKVRVYDLDSEPDAVTRLDKIVSAYKLEAPKMPFLYGLNHTFSGPADATTWKSRVDESLRVEIFTRRGCSRCAKAKDYLPTFQAKYPGLELQIYEVLSDPASNTRFNQLAQSQRIGGVSFPGFWFCKQLVVGFDSEQTSAPRLEAVLKKWTYECELPPRAAIQSKLFDTLALQLIDLHPHSLTSALISKDLISSFEQPPTEDAPPAQDPPEPSPPIESESVEKAQAPSEGQSETTESPPELPIGDEPPALDIGDPSQPPELDITPGEGSEAGVGSSADSDDDTQAIEVPFFGRLSAKRLGMPVFTILIGLVDGFNPCAMWVLLFLLSVLVNLKDRWKILAVAGTFVVISGIAYFAFMAAWLNVFLLVGFLRWVQITLAILAIVVGSIHVKDFFAFKKGISLSIPESAKPGIYSRVRRIVLAESVFAAIAGATVLAVLVNIIELLCTAGLPALYSQVLSLQNYPAWKNYAYLGLYIIAYMFDDSLMVAVVVVTLGKNKLQETQGRWLKLISGLVILLLGLVLLFKPEWLE
jgi:glutaredoxin